jgi:hypothetical protein
MQFPQSRFNSDWPERARVISTNGDRNRGSVQILVDGLAIPSEKSG